MPRVGKEVMKMKTKVLYSTFTAALCMMAALPSWAAGKSVVLTCSGYTGTTTLTDFQALVKLSRLSNSPMA